MPPARLARKAWDPSLHPRDKHGRFTRSRTRISTTHDRNRLKAVRQGFDLHSPNPGFQRVYSDHGKLTGDQRRALTSYLADDGKAVSSALRADGPGDDPTVAAIDSAMKPTARDMVVSRRMSLDAFGGRSVEDLKGKTVRDAAYSSTQLQNPVPKDGFVTARIVVPKGTRALPVGGAQSSEILLDRDQEFAVTKVEQDAQGRWSMDMVALPKDTKGVSTPATPASKLSVKDAAKASLASGTRPDVGAAHPLTHEQTVTAQGATIGSVTRRAGNASPSKPWGFTRADGTTSEATYATRNEAVTGLLSDAAGTTPSRQTTVPSATNLKTSADFGLKNTGAVSHGRAAADGTQAVKVGATQVGHVAKDGNGSKPWTYLRPDGSRSAVSYPTRAAATKALLEDVSKSGAGSKATQPTLPTWDDIDADQAGVLSDSALRQMKRKTGR